MHTNVTLTKTWVYHWRAAIEGGYSQVHTMSIDSVFMTPWVQGLQDVVSRMTRQSLTQRPWSPGSHSSEARVIVHCHPWGGIKFNGCSTSTLAAMHSGALGWCLPLNTLIKLEQLEPLKMNISFQMLFIQCSFHQGFSISSIKLTFCVAVRDCSDNLEDDHGRNKLPVQIFICAMAVHHISW